MNEKAQEYLSPFPRVYREGPYRRAVDYTRPPNPPLSEADATWVEERLRAVGL